jgi:hypothetical protein
VAGGEPADCLVDALTIGAQMVRLARFAEEHQPTRAEMRNHLQSIVETPSSLLRLPDPLFLTVLSYLDKASDRQLDLAGDARVESDIRERARRAPALIPKGGPKGGGTKGAGRGRAWVVPDAPSARDLCALIVQEAWFLSRKKRFGKRNPTAIAAADAYWQACGGSASAWSHRGAEVTGWIKHFRKGSAQDYEANRQRIHNILCLRYGRTRRLRDQAARAARWYPDLIRRKPI